MAAAKLQYCDRLKHSMRRSFVELLDRNRSSFALPSSDKGTLLGGDLEAVEDGGEEKKHDNEIQATESTHRPLQEFNRLRDLAFAITIQDVEAPAPHERVVVGGECFFFAETCRFTTRQTADALAVVTAWIAVISILSFLELNVEQWKLVIGIVVNINLLFFYGAPLSRIVTVMKTRDSSSIHRMTMIMK